MTEKTNPIGDITASVLDTVGALVVLLNPDGRIIFFNKTGRALTGFSLRDVENKPFWEVLVPPEDAASARAHFYEIADGALAEFDTRYWLGKHGRRILVAWSISGVRGAGGDVGYVIATGVDITERRQTEMRSAEQSEQLRSILEAAPDGVITIDEHGMVESFNPTAEKLFGYTAEEVVGRSVNMLMPSPYREHHDAYMNRYLETGEKRIIGIGREVSGQRKDGTTFPMELSVGEARLADRSIFTGFVRDITKRRYAETQIRELQGELYRISRLTEMGQMASAIAHEVNQPLTAITNYVQATRMILTAQGVDLPPQVPEMLEKVLSQADRAAKIIRNIRDFAAAKPSESEEGDINDAVTEASNLGLIGTAKKRINSRLQLAAELPPITFNRVQIQQVVMNLIRNAVEALDEVEDRKREIMVETLLTDDDRIMVAVHDTGPGIPEDMRAKIFESFVSTKPHGIGIGLSLCRSIIQNHDGKLWADPRPGGGTSFRFTLPVTGPREANTPSEAKAPSDTKGPPDTKTTESK